MKKNTFLLAGLAAVLAFSSCKEKEDEDKSINAAYPNGQFVENTCSELSGLASPNGTPSTHIYFKNETDEALKIYWVNQSGGLTAYNEDLQPDEAHLQQTFLQHPWYITTASEECVTIVTALRAAQTDTVRFTK